MADALVQRLRDIRTKGYAAGEKVDSLVDVLGIPDIKSGKMDSLLIHLIRKAFMKGHDPFNADILFMAFKLLSGYQTEDKITNRRKKYLQESDFWEKEYFEHYNNAKYGHEEARKKALGDTLENLRKREEKCVETLAKEILGIESLTAYLDDIPDTSSYPLPRYLTETEDSENIVSHNIAKAHILTPDVPRWDDNHIVGRDDFVASLCQELLIGTPHLQLTGMGGIGKSEILHKVYVNIANNKLQHHFSHIGLLNFNGNIDDLVQQITCPGDGSANSVWHFLRVECSKSNVLLLIYDTRHPKIGETKSDKSETFSNPFEKLLSLNVTVLFASRILHKRFSSRPVKPLSMEECKKLFVNQLFEGEDTSVPPTLKQKDLDILETIIKERAGFNTLIVNRLGAMTRDNGWNIFILSDRLKSTGFSILKGNGDDLDSDELLQDEINKLYRLADVKHPVALNLLEAFAIFPQIPLNQEECVRWLREDAGVDEDYCRRALKMLSKQTWLTYHVDEESDTGSFIMHQMVQSAIMAQANIEFDNHISLVEHCSSALKCDTRNSEKLLTVQNYVIFAASLLNYFHAYQSVEIATLISRLGRFFKECYELDRALEWQHKALSIRKQLLIPKHPDIAASCHEIAQIYEYKDKRKSLDWHLEALVIREEVLGTNHPDTAETYHRIGHLYTWDDDEYLGWNKEAIDWHKKALKVREDIFGTEHSLTAESYGYIADAYYATGEPAQALDWYYKALKIYETKQDLGPNDYLEYAKTCKGIALVYFGLNKDDEASYWVEKMHNLSDKYGASMNSEVLADGDQMLDFLFQKYEETSELIIQKHKFWEKTTPKQNT